MVQSTSESNHISFVSFLKTGGGLRESCDSQGPADIAKTQKGEPSDICSFAEMFREENCRQLFFSTYRNFTNTRSPIFSSRSPFLTDPVSERLETDSLFVLARLEDGVAGVVAVEAFLAVAVLEGSAVFVATLPTEGVGDAARDVGAV